MVSTHNVLVRAIRHAEANDRVGRNVASLVKPPQGKTGRQEQDALQRGQDPHRPQHPQPPGHRGLQPDRDRGAGRDLPAPLPLVRRRQAGITSPAARCGVRKNAAQVSSTRRATACSSSSSRLCSDGRSSGLLPSLTKPPVWPADGGEPDPTGHPDDNIAPTWDRTACPRPGPGHRGASRPSPAPDRCRGAHRDAPHAGQHQPRSAGTVPEDAGCRCWRPEPGSGAQAQPAELAAPPDHRPGGTDQRQMPHAAESVGASLRLSVECLAGRYREPCAGGAGGMPGSGPGSPPGAAILSRAR
jgi:hypothetical protein